MTPEIAKDEARKQLVANWSSLSRIFLSPEDDASKDILLKYMEQILFGLHDFLRENVGITEEVSLKTLSDQFMETRICEHPEKMLTEVITDLIEEIAPQAVNVASPYFVGHMTSAIPFFMVHLKTITAALNQNLVKLETSKIVSILEKQVLAKLHRLIFKRSKQFYKEHVQNQTTMLGSFIDDGTLANLTALWTARNTVLGPKAGFDGVESEGIDAAYKAYSLDRCVVLVSRLGHYSLRKTGGILGIGNKNIIEIETDQDFRMDINALEKAINDIEQDRRRTRILAIVGIAGTTETGTVDPLRKIGEICNNNGIHFHVDAAWGGPTLTSEKYRGILDGIELADSVTVDGHKQFYMPMSCGMVYFKDPCKLDSIAYHARYVNRYGSADLGRKSLVGSREAASIILDSALKIMGTKGYALLIDHGIETARAFAAEINRRMNFELITDPELNILTYRCCPANLCNGLQSASPHEKRSINKKLDNINTVIQRVQRESGKSFVSRTSIFVEKKYNEEIVTLRAVIMNPMTTVDILKEILDEQEDIYRRFFL